MTDAQPQFLELSEPGAHRRIAYIAERSTFPGGVGLLWISGLMSDMASTKATALAAFARQRGLGCTRFDYSGHGASEGRFVDGTIGAWLSEAEAIFRRVAEGPQIVVGSSMGGYMALLLLRRLLQYAPDEAKRIKALVLIAPAWDMTEELMWKEFPAPARRQVMDEGVYLRPSEYGDPYPITRRLIEEGRNHLLARHRFNPGRPVAILHGRLDQDVPFAHTENLMAFLDGNWAEVIEVPDGEHRLSRPRDLERLFSILDRLIACSK